MRKEYYGKLVRDEIPRIIRAKGETPVSRVISRDGFKIELQKKIAEEAFEVLAGDGRDEILSELADVREVLLAILIANNLNTLDFDKMCKRRRRLIYGDGPQSESKDELFSFLLSVTKEFEKVVADDVLLERLIELKLICDDILKVSEFTDEDLERVRKKKMRERGGFSNKVFLVYVKTH